MVVIGNIIKKIKVTGRQYSIEVKKGVHFHKGFEREIVLFWVQEIISYVLPNREKEREVRQRLINESRTNKIKQENIETSKSINITRKINERTRGEKKKKVKFDIVQKL